MYSSGTRSTRGVHPVDQRKRGKIPNLDRRGSRRRLRDRLRSRLWGMIGGWCSFHHGPQFDVFRFVPLSLLRERSLEDGAVRFARLLGLLAKAGGKLIECLLVLLGIAVGSHGDARGRGSSSTFNSKFGVMSGTGRMEVEHGTCRSNRRIRET